jgi:putative membrane protein
MADWMWAAMWGMCGWGPLFVIVFWALVLAGLVLLVRWLFPRVQARSSDPALEVLRRRYAQGEISREEFETRRRDLFP